MRDLPAHQRLAVEMARAATRRLGRMSPDAAVALGAALGRAYAKVRGPRSADAMRNLAIAFPAMSAVERRAIVLRTFEQLGRSAAEVALLDGPHREALLGRFEIDGRERLEAARRSSPSGGVIALTAHFGSWEAAAGAAARAGLPVSVVHHRFENALVDEWVMAWREAAGLETIELGRAGLGVFRALRRGRIVAMLFDQNAHRSEGAFAPFFGVEASTRTGPVWLALRLGVPVVPVFSFRRVDGLRHDIRFGEPIEIEPVSDLEDESSPAFVGNLARMNLALEEAIREAPDQWSWIHRRWKTRPDGETARLYPRRHRLRRGLRDLLSRNAEHAGRP